MTGIIADKKIQMQNDKVAFKYIENEKKRVTLETIKDKLIDMLKIIYKDKDIHQVNNLIDKEEISIKLNSKHEYII